MAVTVIMRMFMAMLVPMTGFVILVFFVVMVLMPVIVVMLTTVIVGMILSMRVSAFALFVVMMFTLVTMIVIVLVMMPASVIVFSFLCHFSIPFSLLLPFAYFSRRLIRLWRSLLPFPFTPYSSLLTPDTSLLISSSPSLP